MSNKYEWGDTLRLMRVLGGYSQESAAKAVNSPLGTFAQYENSSRSPRDTNIQERIASLLGIPTSTLTRGAQVVGPVLWWGRSYEPRQASLIRDLLRELLPGIIGPINVCKEVRLKRGSCFVLNRQIVLIVDEDLIAAANSLVDNRPEIRSVINDPDTFLQLAPGDFAPQHIEALINQADLDPTAAKMLARKMAIVCTHDMEITVDWIQAIKQSLIPLGDGDRKTIARRIIENLYPTIPRDLKEWIINDIISVTAEDIKAADQVSE